MKKSIAALAVAGLFAGASMSAFAADAQVYGVLDTGLSFVHADPDAAGRDAADTFKMTTGQEFGSRWGIRGSEDLGNGMKVGFILESGFESDTGSMEQNGRLFGREASLTLSGDFGALAVGRLPIFGSVLGANGLFRAIDPLFANYTQAFGSGAVTASMWTRVDNAISYRTPTFSGFTGYAMYSFKNDSKTDTTNREGMADSDRYASAAVRFQQGPVEAVLVADTTMYGNGRTVARAHDDAGVTVTLGGNYAFDGGVKLLAFGQYFEDQELSTAQRAGIVSAGLGALTNPVTGSAVQYGFVTGYGFNLGVHVPFMGGVAKAMAGHRDMHNESDVDFKRTMAAVGYDYNLSKRTALYVMGGWSQEKVEVNATKTDATPWGYELTAGMVHRF